MNLYFFIYLLNLRIEKLNFKKQEKQFVCKNLTIAYDKAAVNPIFNVLTLFWPEEINPPSFFAIK